MTKPIERDGQGGRWRVPDDAVEMRVSRTETWSVRFVRPGDAQLPVAVSRRAAPVLIDQRPLPWRRRKAGIARAALAAGVPLATLGALAAWWSLRAEPPRPAAPARVEIDLPPAPLAKSTPPVRVAAARHVPRRVAAPAPIAKQAEARPAAPVSLDTLPQVQAALRRTVTTGAAEPWAAAGLTGYAVTSPIQIDADRACRNVAIWAEAEGAPGGTINRRMCLTEGGAWTLMD